MRPAISGIVNTTTLKRAKKDEKNPITTRCQTRKTTKGDERIHVTDSDITGHLQRAGLSRVEIYRPHYKR